MIPDKIYLPKEEIEGRMPWIAAPYEDDPNWDECYIRKEALLGWAQEHYTGLDITKRDMWDGGYNCAIKELIDKLNSM